MRVPEERITRILRPWVEENVKALLHDGKRVKAVKFVREHTHYSLKEAIELVNSQSEKEGIPVPKYTKQEIMNFIEKAIMSIDLEQNMKDILFDGFDNYEDYEKYGDAFVYPKKK